MKKINLMILIILISLVSTAQDFMTIGEVFDFNVNDEFHFSQQGGNQPPNAERITIIDKYYSENGDTVFYVRFNDSYSTTPLDYPPYLEYHFSTETDTVFYTNLNSDITTYGFWTEYDPEMVSYDTILNYSEYYCDSLVNGYLYEINDFEPMYFSNLFGKGLGLVKQYIYDPVEYFEMDIVLFYYNKNSIGCGNPDETTVSVIENNLSYELNIYPVPANGVLMIENINNFEIKKIALTNVNGQLIKQFNAEKTQLDISEISSGLYFLKIFTNKGELIKKFIIE